MPPERRTFNRQKAKQACELAYKRHDNSCLESQLQLLDVAADDNAIYYNKMTAWVRLATLAKSCPVATPAERANLAKLNRIAGNLVRGCGSKFDEKRPIILQQLLSMLEEPVQEWATEPNAKLSDQYSFWAPRLRPLPPPTPQPVPHTMHQGLLELASLALKQAHDDLQLTSGQDSYAPQPYTPNISIFEPPTPKPTFAAIAPRLRSAEGTCRD